MKSLSQYILETNHWNNPKIKHELATIEGDIKSLGLDETFTDIALSIIKKDRKFKDGRIDVFKIDDSNSKNILDEALDPDNAQTWGIVMYSKSHLIIINTNTKEIRWDSDDNKLKLPDDVTDADSLIKLLLDNKVIKREETETFTVVC